MRMPRRDERGASLVEFALVAPVLFMVLFAIITGGISLSHKLDISTAAREAARFGATVPDNQYGNGDGTDWASAVAQKAIDSSEGALTASGATVCVALVQGAAASTAVFSPSGGTAYYYSAQYVGNSWVQSSSTNPCYSDGGADGQPRVQVLVKRPDELQAVLINMNLTLSADADAHFEYGTS